MAGGKKKKSEKAESERGGERVGDGEISGQQFSGDKGLGAGEGSDHGPLHQANGMGIPGSGGQPEGFTVGFCKGHWSRDDTMNLKPSLFLFRR